MIKGTIKINAERCKGCALCVLVCPQHVLRLSTDTLTVKGYHPARLVDSDQACTGCALCAVVCPDVCITVYRETRQSPNPSAGAGQQADKQADKRGIAS